MKEHRNNAKFEGRQTNGVRDRPMMPEADSCRKEIREWLSHVRFRRALRGGVREADVWKKIAELNILYEKLLEAERIRFDTLLQERTRSDEQPQKGEDSA